MNRAMTVVIFLALALMLLLGIHWYLWVRLVRDTRLRNPWRTIASAALIAAALSVPATLFVLRRSMAHFGGSSYLAWVAFTWLGLMFLFFVLWLAVDAVRSGAWVIRRLGGGAPLSEERRRFIARSLAGGVIVTASAVGAAGIRAAVGPVAVRRVEVALGRLPREHDGITVVQLTDLHIGPTIGAHELTALVETTNALDPDIVAITGDLVDGSVDELRDAVAPLAQLRARHGVFFVTGNHEYFSGAAQWVAEISRLGIRVLRNERVSIENKGSAFDLAGVDDASAARSGVPGHGEDLAKALAGRDRSRALLLLAHQPRTVLRAAPFGVDLQLSGHTHGGQIWPFGLLVRLQQHFLAGLHRHGDTQLYVSRGTGYWGPPMRVAAPAEIAQIVLRARGTSPHRDGSGLG
jgi:predicted MPP superfamily phosphohydrolase